ncbi:MAG: amidohydrolase family protein [Pseudohongiellaceae bacterium]
MIPSRLSTTLLLCSLFIATPVTLANEGAIAFTGARIIDGTGRAPLENGVVVITDGRITAVGERSAVTVPAGAELIDVSGKTLIPGLINSHGHVGDVMGLEGGHYNLDNLQRQLRLYARYGITTVNSLGGDAQEGFQLRDSQNNPSLQRSRLYVAGPVITDDNPAAARGSVDEIADMGADFIKIRIDDNLGRSQKMQPEVYLAILDQTHRRGLPLAVHLYYLEDAKAVLEAGADFIAHSIRDQEVDDELIDLLIENNVCYSPTLTREVSTFVYEEEPDFFSDPFFRSEVDPQVINELLRPERQQRVRNNDSAQQYKAALVTAMNNLDRLAENGAPIAMGTDSGPAARFQGYFEHLEMQMMVDAGMSPMQTIQSATGTAADCLGLDDVGTLEPGKWGDLVVLTGNPLDNIENTKTIESVWIAGNRIPANQ